MSGFAKKNAMSTQVRMEVIELAPESFPSRSPVQGIDLEASRAISINQARSSGEKAEFFRGVRWPQRGTWVRRLLFCAMMGKGILAAASPSPYTPDINTLVLIHFDETP